MRENEARPVAHPPVRVVDKPWGREDWLAVGDRVVLKRLVVEQGHRLSLQYHRQKEEAWIVLAGRARVTLGERRGEIGPGDVVHVRPGTVHRIEAIERLEILEASTPELDDVVRVEDDFGRSGGKEER
ncbi:MAG: cupin domain-containing protein [Acidobacteria bacterium]|nr:MAG: cupin domain-containing protein [Acidobacteriota bacterium]